MRLKAPVSDCPFLVKYGESWYTIACDSACTQPVSGGTFDRLHDRWRRGYSLEVSPDLLLDRRRRAPDQPKRLNLEVPLGLIDTLSSGFKVVQRRPWLVLLPVLLDLWLWLGPHWSIEPLTTGLLGLLAAGNLPPELAQTSRPTGSSENSRARSPRPHRAVRAR